MEKDVTNAISRSSREWYVGKWMSAHRVLRKEAGRIKCFWIWVDVFVHVNGQWCN